MIGAGAPSRWRVFVRSIVTGLAIGAGSGALLGYIAFMIGALAQLPTAPIMTLIELSTVPIGMVVGSVPGLAFGVVNAIVLAAPRASLRVGWLSPLTATLTSLVCGAGLVLLVRAPLLDVDQFGGAIFAMLCAVVGAAAGYYVTRERRVHRLTEVGFRR